MRIALSSTGWCVAPIVFGRSTMRTRCERTRGGWMRLAWDALLHGSDPNGVGHGRMQVIRHAVVIRYGRHMAYDAAGYCDHPLRCRTW